MSVKSAARTAMNRMNMKAVLVAPQYATLASDMREYADADEGLEEASYEKRKLLDVPQAYGFAPSTSDKPFSFSNGVAIIPIHGTLLNRFSYSWGFATGYQFISRQLQAALDDDDVTLIVFDCNSGGGEVAGCFELCDLIFASRTEKPSLAMVDSACYSACYALASSASKVVTTPSSGAGSVGVVAMHVNMGEFYKSMGIEVTYIFAGDHKVDGNPFEALSKEVKADVQASVDKSYAKFTAMVARNRGLTTQAVVATQARCYDADDALSLGLIDAVQTPTLAVAAYLDELTGSDETMEKINMSTTEQTAGAATVVPPAAAAAAPDTAAIAADARKAERTRMAAITGSEEAKGKSKLANYLALETDMTAEQAVKALTAAAPEVTTTASKGDATFAAHMDKDAHPGVGADDSGDGGGQKMSKAERVLKAQGHKPKAVA